MNDRRLRLLFDCLLTCLWTEMVNSGSRPELYWLGSRARVYP